MRPWSIPRQPMNPTEPVKAAMATRARKGRTTDTLLRRLPQGDRRSTAAARSRPRPTGPPRPGRPIPDPSRHGRSDPYAGPCRCAGLCGDRGGRHPRVDQSLPHWPGEAHLRRGTGPVGAARPSRRGGRRAASHASARLRRRRGGCARGRRRRCAGWPSDRPRRRSRPAAPARQQARALRDLPALRRADACHVVA